MNYHEIELNGEVIKFRLRSSDMVEIEKKTGAKLIDFMQDYAITTVVTLLKYMRRAEIPNFSEVDTYALYDKLIDGGYTLSRIIDEIVFETTVISGLISKKDLEEIRDNKEVIVEKKKKELLQK